MKTSKFLLLLLAILIISCGEDKNEIQADDYGYNPEFQNQNGQDLQGFNNHQSNQNAYNNEKQGSFSGNGAEQGKRIFELKDDQGQTMLTYPIPQNWKQGSGDNWLESGDGVVVTKDIINEFNYSHIPDYNQMLRESKIQVRPVVSLERFIKEDVVNLTKKEGMKLINIQRTPSLTNLNSQRSKVWFKGTPEQMFFDSAIVDFVDVNGNPSFMYINYYVASSQNVKRWGYSLTGVDSPRATYEQTKKDFVYALLNSKLNPKYVQSVNQKSQIALQRSTAGHKDRMHQIRQFSANNTRNFNTRSAAFDAQNTSWRNGQITSDRMQTNTINGINDVNTWTDGSGNNFEVDGYHNKVYTNGNGEYMGTDDWNYNPNTDPNMNGNWEESTNKDNGWNN